jgi:arabinogalactan oligomer/maltooligosaccharide transport system substrate-binding protein
MERKLIKFALVLLAVFSFSGCKKALPEDNEVFIGSGAISIEDMKPEEGASLVFWSGNKEYSETIAKAFTEKYNVPITIEQMGYGSIDKIALSGPAGEGADVYMSPHDSFQKGLASGVYMELEDAITNYTKERVTSTGTKSVTSEGKLYGIPVSIEVNCLFYNKDLVDTPAKSLEEIMMMAKDFNDPKYNKFILLSALGDGYNEFPFLSAEGFKLFGENGTDADNPGFDSDEYEKGLQLIAELGKTIPINSTDLSNKSSVKTAFMEGKVAYFITGPWDVTQLKLSGVNFDISTLPTYKGNELTPFAGVQCAHVSPYTKYPIASQLLAAFLISDEGAKILYEEYDGITTLQDISNIEGLSEDKYVKAFVEQFAYSVPMPSVTRVSFFWSIAQDIDKAVFDGKLTPAQGREKAMENWEALLTTE